jgi:Chaperone of endosialidase
MNPLIQFKRKILPMLIVSVLACFGISSLAHAQLPSPTPDGGYPNGNTAEGDLALFNLSFGTAVGFNNTATGFQALFSNTGGNNNTANGFNALFSNTNGSKNTANGRDALFFNTTGYENTASGVEALQNNTTGIDNTANGGEALFTNMSGDNNTANGEDALRNNTTGSSNIGLGNGAGSNLTTGNNNIDIGNQGVAAESNTIRIGTVGTQTATYIAGITGKSVGQGVPVIIDKTGNLGTANSSARFKREIKPMDKASEAILALKPVAFRYKKEVDPEGTPQFGLVAEDVEKVNPDLVARDAQGKVYTVRYDAVNAMLLNEFLKEHCKVQRLEAALAAVNERLKAQDAKIHKVNAKVQLTKPAPQMIASDQ